MVGLRDEVTCCGLRWHNADDVAGREACDEPRAYPDPAREPILFLLFRLRLFSTLVPTFVAAERGTLAAAVYAWGGGRGEGAGEGGVERTEQELRMKKDSWPSPAPILLVSTHSPVVLAWRPPCVL